MAQRAQCIVVMGVTGTGKTRVGSALADELGLPYADGDAFHSAENIEKMRSGIPLDDIDRAPWLAALTAYLRAHEKQGAVLSCSALKRRYRDALRAAAPRLFCVHLRGDAALIAERMRTRALVAPHFMPVSLLASQLAILEPLGPDERGITLNVRAEPDEIVRRIVSALAAG